MCMHVHEKIPLPILIEMTLPWDILPIDDQLIRLGFHGLIRPSLEISALFGLLSLVHDTLLWESPQHVLGRCSSQWAILVAIHSQSSWAVTPHLPAQPLDLAEVRLHFLVLLSPTHPDRHPPSATTLLLWREELSVQSSASSLGCSSK